MKKVKLLIISLFMVLIMFGASSVYAGYQQCNSINFAIKLNSDGTMNVTETWDIYVEKTSTLFTEFITDLNRYTSIENVDIKEITSKGNVIQFTQTYDEIRHVPANCYYALTNNNGNFEMAWGTGLENSSAKKTYQISYKVTDAIKTYNDCSELYWKFVPNNRSYYIENVKGTITLENSVADKNNLRAWAHGPLNRKYNNYK